MPVTPKICTLSKTYFMITPETVLLMDDATLSCFILKVGDRIALKDFCKRFLGQGNNCKKTSLLQKLKDKIYSASKIDVAEDSTSTGIKCSPRSNHFKTEIQIELGWLFCSAGSSSKYVQMRKIKGGGTRKVHVPKVATKELIIKRAVELFFPNGVSSQGTIDQFSIDLFDFQKNIVDDNLTINDFLKITAFPKLRLYLATKENYKPPLETCTLSTSTASFNDDQESETFYTDTNSVSERCDTSEFINSLFVDQQNGRTAEELGILINNILDKEPYDLPEPAQDTVIYSSTIEDLLSNLKKQISTTKINKFNVCRFEIMEGCVRALRRSHFDAFNKISVKFSDIEGNGEEAIDEGGPAREMFRLVLKYIGTSEMFIGTKKKHISLNNTCLQKGYYRAAGQLMALSLVHGGPGPHFFSNTLFSMLTKGPSQTEPNINDLQEDIKKKILEFSEMRDLNTLQDFVLSEQLFSVGGCNFIHRVDEKQKIIEDLVRFFAVHRVVPALDQFIEGLRTCDIYHAMVKQPDLFVKLFCEDKIAVTADLLERLFQISYNESGSNKREIENRIVSYFRDFLLDCEESLIQGSGVVDEDVSLPTLTEILIFATCADSIPPLGFPWVPRIVFLHGSDSRFPIANTCGLELKLPIIHTNYDKFRTDMAFAIKNTNCFGFA